LGELGLGEMGGHPLNTEHCGLALWCMR